MTAQDTVIFVYNLTLIPIIFLSVLFLILCLINLFVDKKVIRYPKLKHFPFVSVQLPTFNDPIALRCLKKCMNFDYPKDRYEIIIADDSTNPETQQILSDYAKKFPDLIKYIHRDNREGFKAGALKNAMHITKGEIIVIFDSDWIPKKNFLKKVVQPFSDPEVAIVQTRQGFYNKNTNLITRFASYSLMIYHTIIMPINNRVNCVFFCGTAGAIRRKAFDKIGGWNSHSLTEDSELSVKLLLQGYKTVYLNIETESEVPDTFESFLKQQMRWCYGNTRVFLDNAKAILFKNKLSIKQRLMIMFITLANLGAPFVVIMSFFGFSGWFLGEPTLMQLNDFYPLFIRFAYTGGFLLMGIITLSKQKLLKEMGYLVLTAFSLGLILAVSNSYALFKAIFNKRLHWYCTPKVDNPTVLR